MPTARIGCDRKLAERYFSDERYFSPNNCCRTISRSLPTIKLPRRLTASDRLRCRFSNSTFTSVKRGCSYGKATTSVAVSGVHEKDGSMPRFSRF